MFRNLKHASSNFRSVEKPGYFAISQFQVKDQGEAIVKVKTVIEEWMDELETEQEIFKI